MNSPSSQENNTAEKPVFLLLGPAGSGITTALKVFSEYGYATIAGLSLPKLVETIPSLLSDHPATVFHLALHPHNSNMTDAKHAIEALKQAVENLNILYLSTPTDSLLQRYSLSQKSHPFEDNRYDLAYTIEQEQLLYQALKPQADYHIDTSTTTDEELALKIAKVLNIERAKKPLSIEIKTFGFKYGAPVDADILFDVRFLPNPFYDKSLRPYSGLDKPVQDYVMGFDVAQTFLNQLSAMLINLIPAYQDQGKTRLNLAIGCTGGQHRSVTMAEYLAEALEAKLPEYTIRKIHREMPHWAHLKPKASEKVTN